MTNYNKIPKAELISMLEREKTRHEITECHLEQASKTAMEQRDAIRALNVDLRIAQRTITRLSVDETMRQDMELPMDYESCDTVWGHQNG